MVRALYGRELEYAALQAAVEDTRRGRGRVVLIDGEPGIGKTRLLEEALSLALSVGVRVHRGLAHELEQDRPLSVLGPALGLDDQRGRDRFQIQETVLAAVEQHALDGAVLIAIDDVHWADELSLDLLSQLIRLTVSMPLALVATMRRLPRRPELERFLRAASDLEPHRISLGALGPAAVASMARDVIGAAPGPTLIHYLEGAGGNPLLLRELASGLVETGVLRQVDGVVDASALSLPPTFRALVMRRVETLAPDVRRLLRVAAVLGDRFSATELATVVRRLPSELLAELEAALGDGIIAVEGAELRFRHQLVRDAVYEDIPLNLRQALHLQAAGALAAAGADAVLVAAHMCQVGSAAHREAVAWLERAGLESMPQAPATAAEIFNRAIVLAGAHTAAGERLLERRAAALIGAGHGEECVDFVKALLPALDASTHGPELRHMLGMAYLQLGATGDAASELETLATVAGTSEQQSSCWLGDAALARLLSGDMSRARALTAESRALAERTGDEHALSVALASEAMIAYFEARLPEAVRLSRQAVALARQSPAREALYRPVHLWLGLSLAGSEQFEESTQVLRFGRSASEAAGMGWHIPLYHAVAGRAAWLAGNWDDMVAEMETSLALAEESNIGWVVPQRSCLCYVAYQRGDFDRAQAELTAAERALANVGPQFGVEALLWVRGLLAESAGRAREALDLLMTAWELLRGGYYIEFLDLGPDLVRLAVALGEHDVAAAAVAEVELAARDTGLASATGVALRCRGLLEGSFEVLESAVAPLRQGRRRLDLAFACHDAGVAAAARGDDAAAVHLLEEALHEFRQADARLAIGRTAAALRKLGVRSREPRHLRRRSVGWQALTATELSVTRLAVRGLTSREIGINLSISRRTVETHLAHVYAKLGYSSRVELATAYAQERQAAMASLSRQAVV